MESLALSNMTMPMTAPGKEAMAALVNEASVALDSASLHGTASGIGVVILCMMGASLILLVAFYCGLSLMGFTVIGPLALSIAASWMASLGVVAAGSLYAVLQSIAMGGVSVLVVWLILLALVTVAVGGYEVVVWLLHNFHFVGAWFLHGWHSASAWLVGPWHSAVAWLLQGWHSASAWLLGPWHSAVAWLHDLWNSIPGHHKWKILYT